MRKKSAYVWSLVAALMMTACSSDQNDEKDGALVKTGTFELSIDFATPGPGTRGSSAIPTTSWDNIKQIQFFLYDKDGKIAWSAIEEPKNGSTSGTGKKYTYATVPAAIYTLVAVANAYSATDDVTTSISSTELPWSVSNVFERNVTDLAIKHKVVTGWSSAITGTALTELGGLTPHIQPSEVFMGSVTGVEVKSTAPATANVSLTREVSMMRVRIDQKTYEDVVKNVVFTDAGAAVMLYNLPGKMSIQHGDAGGVGVNNAVANNALSAVGAFSTVAGGYLDDGGKYSSWKEVMVFPNNGGRGKNSNTGADAAEPYFIVICGIAGTGHYYAGTSAAAGDSPAPVGAPVFWYGQINEVFTPNIIREVDVILKTGGSPNPPPKIVEYGKLDIIVGAPAEWGAIVTADPIEL